MATEIRDNLYSWVLR